MPITYDAQQRTFHLCGRHFSYCLHVGTDGDLLCLYWGARLPSADITYLLDSYHDGASFDMRTNRLPYDMPTRGTGWYGTPACGAINRDGNDVVSLKYAAHRMYPGKPMIRGLPATYAEDDNEAQTLVVVLKDELTGLVTECSYSVFEELDVLTRSMQCINEGTETLTLTHMQSASVPLFGRDYDLIHLKGGWARERAVVRSPIGEASVRIQSQRGASGHEENPFLCVLQPDATEFYGQVWAMNLVYSGSFLAEAHVNNYNDTRLSIGLNPDTCRWRLDPGERFQTPEAVLVYSGNGLNGMSQKFHALYRTRLCRGYWRDRERPILINNWEATYFSFNETKILDIARTAKDAGIELFVLDDGWFGKRDSDNCSLGDWVADRRKLPGGIDGLARKINDLGMMFGLWVEPEMVSPDSGLYRAHPDWCLHAPGRPRTEARNQLILDLSREEVQDYIIESICAVLGSAPIQYIKWDMNRNMTEHFSGDRDPLCQLETQHRYMLGLYRVLEAITSRFPQVLFESCSGGGGRFDPGILFYMPQTWTSDNTDPVERIAIQYGTSYAYPPCAMGAHVSASPNHQTGRKTTVKMRGDVALGGNFGYELDLGKLSAEEMETVRAQVSQVKALRKTLQQGTFTRLMSPFGGNTCAWQFVSSDGRQVILCFYQRLALPNPTPYRVFPQSLCEHAIYHDLSTGKGYTGAALMYAGLPLEAARADFFSQVVQLQRES